MTLYQLPILGGLAAGMNQTTILRTGIVRAVQFVWQALLTAPTANGFAAGVLELSRQAILSSDITGPINQIVALSSVSTQAADLAGTGTVSAQSGGTIVPCAVRVNLGDLLYVNGRAITEAGTSGVGWVVFWVED